MNGRDVLGSLLISTMHRQFPRPRDTFMNPTRPGHFVPHVTTRLNEGNE